MGMDIPAWIGLLTLFGGVVIYAVLATVYVSSKDAKLQAQIAATETTLQAKISTAETTLQTKIAAVDVQLREKSESVYNLAVTKQEVAIEKESKARHDLANQMQVRTGELIIDIKNVDKRINELVGTMATKDDLKQLENRLTAYLDKLGDGLDKLRDEVKHS